MIDELDAPMISNERRWASILELVANVSQTKR